MIFTGIVLLDSKQRIFLIKEDDKNNIGKDRWNLPGGSVDHGETLIQSAEREVFEETGYESKPQSLLGVYKATNKQNEWIYIVFESQVNLKSKSNNIDKSVKEGCWFSKSEFFKLAPSNIVHTDMLEVYKVAIEKKGLPLKTVKFIEY